MTFLLKRKNHGTFQSGLRLRHGHSQYLPPVIVHQGVTLARVESMLAIWKGASHVSCQMGGDGCILLAMPEMDLFANVFEAETPGAGERDYFPVQGLCAIAIGFAKILTIDSLYVRPSKHLSVDFRQRCWQQLFSCDWIQSYHPHRWLKRET